MIITPLGAVSRLEHALSNVEGEREGHRSRLGKAERRQASYRSRIGEVFAYAADLGLEAGAADGSRGGTRDRCGLLSSDS